MLALKRPISRREQEILVLTAGGNTDKEICVRLNLGEHTIKIYQQRLRDKLGWRYHRSDTPGICLLLGLISIADVTHNAVKFLLTDRPEAGSA